MFSLYPYILLLVIFLCLTLEGLGVQLGREISFIFILVLPISLLGHALLLRKGLRFPKNIAILFLIYILATLVSALISKHFINSLSYLFYYISLFIVFLFSYTFHRQLEKPMIIGIISMSVLYSITSLLFSSGILTASFPSTGYQFVSAGFLAHNHLGDFLSLSVIVCIYFIGRGKNVKLSILGLFIFLPLVGLSYSRSAYISIAVCYFILHLYLVSKKRPRIYSTISRIFVIIALLTTIYLSITTSRQAITQPLSSDINKYLVQNEGLKKTKDLFGNRQEYLRQALLSIHEYPLFGVGPNNFLYISQKYSENPLYGAVDNAHNIFIEVAVGQGILGLTPFFLLILYILLRSKKNVLFFVFACMLINFQTDYTYNFYSFLLLFFAIGGVVFREKDIATDSSYG